MVMNGGFEIDPEIYDPPIIGLSSYSNKRLTQSRWQGKGS